MTDPLAGMTVKEAREFVEEERLAVDGRLGYSIVQFTHAEADMLVRLAALGAECVGAQEKWADTRADGSLIPSLWDGPDDAPFGSRRVLVLKEDR